MSKTLTRADLSEAIYSRIGISKVESSDIVDQIFEEMILELIGIDYLKNKDDYEINLILAIMLI